MKTDIHELVKDYFQNISIQDLFEVGKDNLVKRNSNRLMGKRSLYRVQQARQRQLARGRKAYYPSDWMVGAFS